MKKTAEKITGVLLSLLLIISLFSSCSEPVRVAREDDTSASEAEAESSQGTVTLTFPEGYSVSKIALKLE